MGPGQPHVQRHHTGLRPEPDYRQHEGAAPHPGGQVCRPGGDGDERLAPGVGGQEDQAHQQGGGTELGHHRVPLTGRAATSDRRRWSTRTSRSEVTAISSHRNKNVVTLDAAGTSSRVVTNKGQDARRRPAGQPMPVVAEAEDHGADPDDGADGDEQGPETIERHREAAEWQQCRGVDDRHVSGVEYFSGHDDTAGAGGDGEGDRDVHPDSQWRHRTDSRGGQSDQRGNDEQVGRHVPARPRSAVMIVSGSGGHPGISRSTGTTSATAPSTP